MKRTGTAVIEEEKPTGPMAELDETVRAMLAEQQARRAEREQAQQGEQERIGTVADRIAAYCEDFRPFFRAAAEKYGDMAGEHPNGFGPPLVIIAPGRFELIGTKGYLKVRVRDDGRLHIEPRVFGSGCDDEIILTPAADGGLEPAPAAAVLTIFTPWLARLKGA